jgi:hypothetical protein
MLLVTFTHPHCLLCVSALFSLRGSLGHNCSILGHFTIAHIRQKSVCYILTGLHVALHTSSVILREISFHACSKFVTSFFGHQICIQQLWCMHRQACGSAEFFLKKLFCQVCQIRHQCKRAAGSLQVVLALHDARARRGSSRHVRTSSGVIARSDGTFSN